MPVDVPTVQEAVAMAASGDTILLQSENIDWNDPETHKGVEIIGKDLLIAGEGTAKSIDPCFVSGTYPREPGSSPQNSFLWVENSHVVMRNLQMEPPPRTYSYGGYAAKAIRVLSGSLSFVDCSIIGTIETEASCRFERTQFQSYTYVFHDDNVYSSATTSDPAFYIHSATGIQIEMIDSQLYAAGMGYQGMCLDDVHSSTVRIIDSAVTAGTSYGPSRSFVDAEGGDGIRVRECTDLDMMLSGSQIGGGRGHMASTYSWGGIQEAGRGGHGIILENSDVFVEGGELVGGQGGAGIVVPRWIAPQLGQDTPLDGGDGGNGLALYGSSARICDVSGTGGIGGGGATLDDTIAERGEDGVPFFMDQFSTLHELSEVSNWWLLDP
ncbi:MAG: hypothetical protein ABIH23_28015 [bacterium]